MEMDMDSIFREYGMDGIEAQLGELFPTLQIDLETLLKQAFTGDIKGALAGVVQMTFGSVITDLASLKNTFLLLLLMGIGAALISHFIRIFDKHQVADAGFYFLYLYMAAVLMKCFSVQRIRRRRQFRILWRLYRCLSPLIFYRWALPREP